MPPRDAYITDRRLGSLVLLIQAEATRMATIASEVYRRAFGDAEQQNNLNAINTDLQQAILDLLTKTNRYVIYR
jgi:hypothetical protein